MKKDKFNVKLASYAKSLSPTEEERSMITSIYNSINELLGTNNCIQIGSYPRKTSITPVHDLDILYFLGQRNEENHNPYEILNALFNRINKEYRAPMNYTFEASLQTHSVTICYKKGEEEIFGVDIVPGYIYGKNENGDDTYKVPEITYEKHYQRKHIYDEYKSNHKDMGWITSDPRRYITTASELDEKTNGNLRKTVKLVKRRKNNLRQEDETLKLKSFHLEQIISQIFGTNPEFEMFDAIFKFFVDLPKIIGKSNQIQDKANKDKYIDDYLDKLTLEQKNKIIEARNRFLIKLENLKDESDIGELFEISFYKRKSLQETFLFDQGIQTLTDENYRFRIVGHVLMENQGSFRGFDLNQKGTVGAGRKIQFRLNSVPHKGMLYKWKVKNDDNCEEPRGEITDNKTKFDPEETKFPGNHYVECFGILNNICVFKTRQNVNI